MLLMSNASSYPVILLAAMLIGMGSSIFHPEASRVARMAAGGRYGLAQGQPRQRPHVCPDHTMVGFEPWPSRRSR